MKLNLDIIGDYLPKSYKIEQVGAIDHSLSLSAPMLYEADIEWDPDYVYVSRSATLPPKPPQKGLCVICVDQSVPLDWLDKGCQFLLISSPSHLISVFNEVTKVFRKFGQWDEAIRDLLESDKMININKMIDKGIEIIQNPISVADGNMLHIFKTEMIKDKHSGDIQFKVIDQCKDDCLEGFEQIKASCGLERGIKEPYISAVKLDDSHYYCYNLYLNHVFSGCIAIKDSHRSFRESDYALADYFFHYFQKAYSNYLRYHGGLDQVGESALQNLLAGLPLSLEEKEELSLSQGESWVFYKLNTLRNRQHMPLDYMLTVLNTLIPRHLYGVIDNREIVGLMKVNGASLPDQASIFNSFENLLLKMGYIAGVSNRFKVLNDLMVYEKQALYALETGYRQHRLQPSKSLYYYKDYQLQYILTRYNGSFSYQYLLNEGLLNLIEHDRLNDTEYVKTLTIYLNHEMGITATADALFLHRSSLMSRLKRIKKVLGIDWDNPEEKLYLRICLQVHQMYLSNDQSK